jgi:uncharacterized protein YkwD
MNARRFKSMGWVAALVAAGLVGCGGGGGGGSSEAPYVPPKETPVAPAPVESARMPFNATTLQNTYSGEHKSAFDRLNAIRQLAGVGALVQSAVVDVAAQGHSQYQQVNGVSGHKQSPGKIGFKSAEESFGPPERIKAAGYVGLVESQEVLIPLSLSSCLPTFAQTGAQLVDVLMGLPFHRQEMLNPAFANIGVGFTPDPKGGNLTIDFARTEANTQGAPDLPNNLIIWPTDQSGNLPTAMWYEDPDPITENGFGCAQKPAGYAASIQVNGNMARYITRIEAFDMIEMGTGAVVDTKLLAAEGTEYLAPALRARLGNLPRYSNPNYAPLEDPRNSPLYGGTFAAVLPKAPLKKLTSYRVVFKGEVAQANRNDVTYSEPSVRSPVTREWTFTTGDKVDF